TGPRPRGRGIPLLVRASFPRSDCFNGAAPARARNLAGPPDSHFITSCFNGAAPARARNHGSAWPTATPNLASTGPRPRGRGIKNERAASPLLQELQRGRARAGAESALV